MSRVVFLLEEPSMKVLLEGLIPRLFPKLPFLCVSHEGKQDLEKSIPRKLRAWREPVSFVVVRDNDCGDCHQLKQHLVQLAAASGRPDTLVRIVCQELEAWYLGCPGALVTAFGNEGLARTLRAAKYRDPDSIDHPARDLSKLVSCFQKVSGARKMAQVLTRENSSRSFQVFMETIEVLATRLALHESSQQGD